MKSTQLLETIAQRSSDNFVWRASFAIEAITCGMSHTPEWNIATRTLTVCYEMAEEFALLLFGLFFRSPFVAALRLPAKRWAPGYEVLPQKNGLHDARPAAPLTFANNFGIASYTIA